MKTLGVVGFKDLCDEVSKIGMAPRGVVKLVLDLSLIHIFSGCLVPG